MYLFMTLENGFAMCGFRWGSSKAAWGLESFEASLTPKFGS